LRHVRDGLRNRQGPVLVLLVYLVIREAQVQPEAEGRDHQQDPELGQDEATGPGDSG
jgi:hypothetical protein